MMKLRFRMKDFRFGMVFLRKARAMDEFGFSKVRDDGFYCSKSETK